MEPAEVGEDVQDRHPDHERRHVQQVEREVAGEDVARRVAVAEDPQLGQDEVVERGCLRGEDGRQEVVDPEPVRQQEERDLVDDDPEDADERELRGAEQSPQETANVRLAVPARLLLDTLLGRDLGASHAGWSRVL